MKGLLQTQPKLVEKQEEVKLVYVPIWDNEYDVVVSHKPLNSFHTILGDIHYDFSLRCDGELFKGKLIEVHMKGNRMIIRFIFNDMKGDLNEVFAYCNVDTFDFILYRMLLNELDFIRTHKVIDELKVIVNS